MFFLSALLPAEVRHAVSGIIGESTIRYQATIAYKAAAITTAPAAAPPIITPAIVAPIDRPALSSVVLIRGACGRTHRQPSQHHKRRARDPAGHLDPRGLWGSLHRVSSWVVSWDPRYPLPAGSPSWTLLGWLGASPRAVFSAEGHVAPKHPPGEATLRTLEGMLKAEVGTCRLGDWEAFAEVGGARAGWMTTVRGRGVAKVAAALGER